jgi:hypothetical protein
MGIHQCLFVGNMAKMTVFFMAETIICFAETATPHRLNEKHFEID